MKKTSSLWKSTRLGLIVLLVLIVYAYGFQVTKVDLSEFRKESRQVSRIRVTRALAKPDIFEYEQEELIVSAPIYVPCPAGEIELPSPDTSGPYMVLTPPCNDPGEEIQIEGFNFTPGTKGPISFIPSSDPNYSLALQRGRVEVNSEGHFAVTIELPERPGEDIQYLRVTARRNVGLPRFSQSAHDTWDKIIETVFLALLATTIGTALAMPVSFVAARNIMKDVKSPLANIALSILGWPVGIVLGYLIARSLGNLSQILSTNLTSNIGGALISPAVAWGLTRWAFYQTGEGAESRKRSLRTLALAGSALMGGLAFYQVGQLGMLIGSALRDSLGPMGFLGNFIYQSGDILGLLTPAMIALIGGATASNTVGKLGQGLSERSPENLLKVINLLLASVAGGSLFFLFGAGINWLYEINDPVKTMWVPGAVGALLGAALALRAHPKEPLPIGITLYYITRTILNATRSVEALIMAIVAVIWVGIGPFAGTMALALHTVAALAKLYSEQVESILPGPIEAVQATGANRLQTIVYAVIPQIIPPYISFTMYRWDINVRMSTIIGFAGGGGIGFLLQQNINLLNYRAASTQMLAIAIVVATMDYVSSTLRERFV